MKAALPPESAEVVWNCCSRVKEVTRAPCGREGRKGVVVADRIDSAGEIEGHLRTTFDYSRWTRQLLHCGSILGQDSQARFRSRT